uniref:Glycosyltransferase n=1 Tax=Polygala tenuifolia TaxID=355332 RepID=A0A3G3NBH3_9FABA|nr:UDP-glucosyltransferase UGT74AT1 [Polygala tenuifolia]
MEGVEANKTHCIVLAYPAQGHLNPMVQFSKRLIQKGVRVTLVTTHFYCKNLRKENYNSISIEGITDGFDEGGAMQSAEDWETYLNKFWQVGPASLAELLEKFASSGSPAGCLVYDSFMPWALDVAKKYELVGAVFLTQSCAVNNVYYHVHEGLLKTPISEHTISLPGLPELAVKDLPSFVYSPDSYPVLSKLIVDIFSSIGKADWVLCNTFYELEEEAVKFLSKVWPLRPIGPAIPSMYLDQRHQDDTEYGLSILNQNTEVCLKWLGERPKRSVVYVSFGSLASLNDEQMKEIAYGLKDSESDFLWIVREPDEAKLPKHFAQTLQKGLVMRWCPQLQVLAHDAVGCFFTHCGWNSTLEAISLGVPMIAMPQWTDQTTNSKFIMDVWRVGVKVQLDERGIAKREAIKQTIKEVMEGERGKDIRENSIKWKALSQSTFNEGGSSEKNIDDFVSTLMFSPK